VLSVISCPPFFIAIFFEKSGCRVDAFFAGVPGFRLVPSMT
jgi:hypothetical protein